MSVGYTGIQWNRQKRVYDAVLFGILLAGLATYVLVSSIVRPQLTVETLVLRGTAVSAFLLLHVILCIGPLARLNPRFLPLLYNRRHLGVTTFLLALIHAVVVTVQFHAQGNVNPLVSIFVAYRRDYDPFATQTANIAHFPFEPLGVLALAILFVMAATSHDFWLKNLGPSFWKTLHLLVLVAYGALVLHVAYGALQSETRPLYVALLGAGCLTVLGLHVAAGSREARRHGRASSPGEEGYVAACEVDRLREGRGKVVRIGKTRVALFLQDAKVFALSNVCAHQGGPLGEGRIVDGCVTCPWHGWQYRPGDGCSPPPFEEQVETYRVRVADGRVFVHPEALPPGTPRPGAPVGGEGLA